MAQGTGIQKAAMKLKKETGVEYMTCLNILREHKGEAEELKMNEPLRPFTECLLEVGRKYIEIRS